jgi:hypothetical protein
MVAARCSGPVRSLAVLTFLLCLCLWTPAAPAAPASSQAPAEARNAALAVMDAFLAAFNARDEAAWADTLLFPHVRIASGGVVVYPDRASFLDAMDLSEFAEQTGWDYSTWDELNVVQTSASKVHITVTFTRYDEQGEKMASYDSLYVVENIGGRWGVRARSSFAP